MQTLAYTGPQNTTDCNIAIIKSIHKKRGRRGMLKTCKILHHWTESMTSLKTKELTKIGKPRGKTLKIKQNTKRPKNVKNVSKIVTFPSSCISLHIFLWHQTTRYFHPYNCCSLDSFFFFLNTQSSLLTPTTITRSDSLQSLSSSFFDACFELQRFSSHVEADCRSQSVTSKQERIKQNCCLCIFYHNIAGYSFSCLATLGAAVTRGNVPLTFIERKSVSHHTITPNYTAVSRQASILTAV